MMTEMPQKEERMSPLSHLYRVLEFSGLKQIGNSLIDSARKISYPLSFASALMTYELAHGAEIPRDASLSQGVTKLHEGAKTEIFETGATYIEVNGRQTWISKEGEIGTVENFGNFNYAERELLKKEIIALGAEAGDEIIIKLFHNHPLADANGKKKSLGYELLPDATTASMPPSGFGILSIGIGDTEIFRSIAIQTGVETIQKELDVTIHFEEYAVDTLGIWNYGHVWQEEEMSENHKDFSDLFTKANNNEPHDEERIRELASQIYTAHQTAVKAWFEASQTMPMEYLMESDLYTDLVKAFADLGVRVAYKPFAENTQRP